MSKIGVHEYIRILAPAFLFVAVMNLIFPNIIQCDTTQLLAAAAVFGLIITPFSDRIAKKWFHRQVIHIDFYAKFITAFACYHSIGINTKNDIRVNSFSGHVDIPQDKESLAIIKAYKIFARHGWSGHEDSYRIRTEKSLAILYFTMFIYTLITLLVSIILKIHQCDSQQLITGVWSFDAILYLAIAAIFISESTSRFRMSIKNELLVLEANMKSIFRLYRDIKQQAKKEVE